MFYALPPALSSTLPLFISLSLFFFFSKQIFIELDDQSKALTENSGNYPKSCLA